MRCLKMFRTKTSVAWIAALLTATLWIVSPVAGQESPATGREDGTPHLRKQAAATQLIVDGKPWIMLAGELHNSSASSLEYMEPIWDRLVDMNLNTVLATVSWELLEPEEGRFDFRLVDGLIDGARQHDLRLVLLWFGSYKNAVSSYAPPWVKLDKQRFPHALRADGRPTEMLSTFGEATCAADARAFAALLRHLREVDARQHTVVMVQVENEAGLRNDTRDRSPAAEAAFAGPVPAELTEYLDRNKATLIPELGQVWQAAGSKTAGTWSEVFGNGADEVFMAWQVGRFIGRVAAAGKAEYPLPMFANAWLIQFVLQKPGDYPSGGPVSKMMDVWRAAAPAIDFLAPDIYLPDFKGVCASYMRSGNPLMIPETSRDDRQVGRVFWAVAECNAMGYSPFGIDYSSRNLGECYRLLGQLMPIIAEYQGTGQMIGILQDGDEEGREAELGDYRAHIRFEKRPSVRAPNSTDSAFGLIVALAPDEFLLAGTGFNVHFSYKKGASRDSILELTEGRYESGRWIPGRRLNGDESGGGYQAQLPPNRAESRDKLYTLRIKMYHYD